ncbi:MAG: ABC-F family ATP-binding cassette domain-containing protein, partial [Chloroflexi bacterium]|nr:ABC-F family ATP-binding cassette domain-containing protein [Chloroflexota bacterium]
TTLLRLIAGELAPLEGVIRVGANVRLGYLPQQVGELPASLPPAATPLSIVRGAAAMSETEARTFLHTFLFAGDEVFVPVRDLSYGERSRLLLARLVIGGANCLLLDEPTNHLDIPSREQFEAALDAFPGTVLVSIHDRAFIERFATAVWVLKEGEVERREVTL